MTDQSQMDLYDFLNHDSMGGGEADSRYPNRRGSSIWGWVGPKGRQIGLIGQHTGTAFVEIDKKGKLTYLGRLPAQDPIGSSWREIRVLKNYAIIGNGDNHKGRFAKDLWIRERKQSRVGDWFQTAFNQDGGESEKHEEHEALDWRGPGPVSGEESFEHVHPMPVTYPRFVMKKCPIAVVAGVTTGNIPKPPTMPKTIRNCQYSCLVSKQNERPRLDRLLVLTHLCKSL